MCTYNGQKYLAAQLDSFINQTHKNWDLWVSDDGSTDDTLSILKDYQVRLPDRIYLYDGPKQGFAANFLSLTLKANEKAPYFAYADQDDIWEPFKLERALKWLTSIKKSIPSLYCARTHLIDSENKTIGFSPLFNKGSGFLNALVQNIGGGNTMVFNHATLMLLRETRVTSPIIAHDWWTYLLVTGADGKIFYDSKPTVLYRQHQANLIGGNQGLLARLRRIKMMFQGNLKHWIDLNTQALLLIDHTLTAENQLILKRFIAARQAPSFINAFKVRKLGVYRQTFLGNVGLILGLILKKI